MPFERRSVARASGALALLVALVALAGPGCLGGDSESKACKAECPIEVIPVCGVDGKDYKNACYAKCAGTTARFEGECNAGKGSVIPEDMDDGD